MLDKIKLFIVVITLIIFGLVFGLIDLLKYGKRDFIFVSDKADK